MIERISVFKSDAVDLLGIRDDKCLIIEAKTITKKNLVSQTRKGLMKLGEYRYRYLTEAEGHQNQKHCFCSAPKHVRAMAYWVHGNDIGAQT